MAASILKLFLALSAQCVVTRMPIYGFSPVPPAEGLFILLHSPLFNR